MTKIECVSDYLIVNNQLVAASNQTSSSDLFVYEILRVIDGVPVFVEDYYGRFINSLKIKNIKFDISLIEFKNQIIKLISKTQINQGNIKIIAEYNTLNEIENLIIYQIKHNYPTARLYSQGVKTVSFHAERDNPNAKQNLPIREKAEEFIRQNGAFEAIYISRNNLVLEGSRTNLFFIKNDEVYTANADTVLKGITRLKVLEAINNIGYKLIETEIPFSLIETYSASFLTGTSPKVLPVNCIDSIDFDVNNAVLKKIMFEFDLIQKKYILNHKSIY